MENEIHLNDIRKHSNRKEETRFPYRLFQLLSIAGKNYQKSENTGCGWVSDTEFFIDKKKICSIMNIKINTLNANLKNLGFEKSRSRDKNLTFFKNKHFSLLNKSMNFKNIRNSQYTPKQLFNSSAIYLAYLEKLKLFNMTQQEINQFKIDVAEKWNEIVQQKLLFSMSLSDFAQHLECYLDDDKFIDLLLIHEVLVSSCSKVCGILDFAAFLARFGPFCDMKDKFYKYIDIKNEVPIRQSKFTTNSENFFSKTYHNCFFFPHCKLGEYHCYNLPHICVTEPFLMDEDGDLFHSWNEINLLEKLQLTNVRS